MNMQAITQYLHLLFHEKVAGGVFISTLLLLILPESTAQHLHLTACRNEYGNLIGLALLGSLSVLLVHLLSFLARHSQQTLHTWKEKRAQKRELALQRAAIEEQKRILRSLSQEQEAIIRNFTEKRTIQSILNPYTAALHELEQAGILIPDGGIFLSGDWCRAYKLSETAIKHLYHQGKGT